MGQSTSMLPGFFVGDSPDHQFKLVNKREEISYIHLVPYNQTILKTHGSQTHKKLRH